jgi:hypothetical protein
MPDLEAGVPEQADDLLHSGGLLRRGLFAGVEKQDVHIAEGVHLAAPVASESDHGKACGFGFFEMPEAHLREDAAEEDVHEIAALAHDFTSARAGRDAQAQAVFLQPAVAAVSLERPGGGFAAGLLVEVFGSAGQDFFQGVTHGSGRVGKVGSDGVLIRVLQVAAVFRL